MTVVKQIITDDKLRFEIEPDHDVILTLKIQSCLQKTELHELLMLQWIASQKIPLFRPTDSKIWFYQIKNQFTIAEIANNDIIM